MIQRGIYYAFIRFMRYLYFCFYDTRTMVFYNYYTKE